MTGDTPHQAPGMAWAATRAQGYLFGWSGLAGLTGVLAMAAWFREMPIAVLTAVVLSTAGLARLWACLSLKGVRLERVLHQDRAFPGEAVEVGLRLENRKPLPLPWVDVADEVPTALQPASGPAFSVSLMGYRAITRRRRLLCRRRGYYPLGPAVVSSGDIFGLYHRQATFPRRDYITVYPKLYPLEELGLPSAHPLGESRAARRLFQDPTRTIGVRDHQPQDPLRHIHWKATARQGRLQVKVFEPTTTLNAILFLGVEGLDGEALELAISAVASVARHLIEERSLVGLMANSPLYPGDQPVELPSRSGVVQLVSILEALARTNPPACLPLGELLDSHRAGLPYGATLVFVGVAPGPALLSRMAELRQASHPVTLLHTDGMTEGLATQYGIDTRHLSLKGASQ